MPLPWAAHGLREGIVTTRYPRRPDGYGDAWPGCVVVDASAGSAGLDEVAAHCPTGAIELAPRGPRLDRGRCILCGRCVRERADVFSDGPGIETSASRRDLLVVPEEPREALEELGAALAKRVKALRRSIYVRHVDCGSDGSDEWEVAALTNPVYDVQRLGIFFTASPRHADLLLVTGAGAGGMVAPLQRTYDAMPEPKVVVAVGTDAASGGMFAGSYATRDGVAGALPIDVFVPGSPPSPFAILHGILLAVGLVASRSGSAP